MIYTGDCLSVMPTLPANSVDSVICDPPYGLDFMGKSWDHGVPGIEFWQAALRVAKPGAILMAFGGTRTYHRLTCAIEDAGWEIRDGMCWLYGSGFPKSLDISKAIDKAAGAEREVVGQREVWGRGVNRFEDIGQDIPVNGNAQIAVTAPSTPAAHLWQGWGTALKPAWEPIIVAMKPLEGTYAENAQKWGVAGLNIDGSLIGYDNDLQNAASNPLFRKENGHKNKQMCDAGGSSYSLRREEGETERIVNSQGRWPANLLLDEESARLLGGPSRFFYTSKAPSEERPFFCNDCNAAFEASERWEHTHGHVDEKGKQTWFHIVTHPTQKPEDLMRYLCKLTRTPTGGVVLDPFMGSGTTGVACILEHRDFIGIEIDANYAEIAKKRIADMEGPLFQEAA